MRAYYFVRHRKGNSGWGLNNVSGGFKEAHAYAQNYVELNYGSAVVYSQEGNMVYGHLEDGTRVPYAESPIYGKPLKPHEERALASLMSR